VTRTAALAVVALGMVGVGVPMAAHWPDESSALECPPDRVRFLRTPDGESVAQCSQAPVHPSQLPVAAALTLGQKLDLNEVSENDLGKIPGVGRRLAKALVEAREDNGPFRTWDEVDAVEGVGFSKLEALRTVARIGEE